MNTAKNNFLKVACAIIYQNDKILVTQRGPSMSLSQKWEFPGGKLEQNESPEQCIVREIKEELKINIVPLELMNSHFHDYGEIKIELIPVKAKFISGTISLLEHSNFLWLSPDELTALDWAAADKTLVTQLTTKPSND